MNSIGLTCLVVLFAVAFGCNTTPSTDESRRPPDDALPVTSPAPIEQEFVPDPRTFRIIPASSEARYEVDEELTFLGMPLHHAIGRTSEVSGEFSFYRDSPNNEKLVVTSGQFQVDLSTLTSDDSRRDERIRGQWLESARFPLAKFEAKEVRGFPDGVPNDDSQTAQWSFELKGEMTVRDITREETFQVRVTLVGGKMEGTASTLLKMKDYGFDPPGIAGLFKVEDGVDVVLEFRAEEVMPAQ